MDRDAIVAEPTCDGASPGPVRDATVVEPSGGGASPGPVRSSAGHARKRTGRPPWSRLDPVRAGFVVLVAGWLSAYLRVDGHWTLLDDVDLAIHETGHIVFPVFGEFMGVAGGSLFQLLVPAAFVLYFVGRGDRFAAFVVLFWLSQSLFNVAVYIADARAQVLPLVGGEYVIHDWSWLLSRLHVLRQDRTIAGVVRVVAGLLYLTAAGGALWHARRPVREEGRGPVPAPDARGEPHIG